ncbi:MAG: hypothetical protein QOE59_3591 [Actinomycetota bacterium]|nr:hypothetical protein [Actinomycetota bacterium]
MTSTNGSTARGWVPRRDDARGGPVGASSDRYLRAVRQSQPASAAISFHVAPAARSGANLLMSIHASTGRITGDPLRAGLLGR